MSEQMREALETVTDAFFNFYAMVEGESPSWLVDDPNAEDAWRAIEVGKAALAASPAQNREPVAWLEHSLEGDVIGVTLHPDGFWPTTPLYAAPVDETGQGKTAQKAPPSGLEAVIQGCYDELKKALGHDIECPAYIPDAIREIAAAEKRETLAFDVAHEIALIQRRECAGALCRRCRNGMPDGPVKVNQHWEHDDGPYGRCDATPIWNLPVVHVDPDVYTAPVDETGQGERTPQAVTDTQRLDWIQKESDSLSSPWVSLYWNIDNDWIKADDIRAATDVAMTSAALPQPTDGKDGS